MISAHSLVGFLPAGKGSCHVLTKFALHASMQLDLWKTSGHYDFYRESMFNQMEIDTEEYQARDVPS